MNDRLMDIQSIHKTYRTSHGDVQVLEGVSFQLQKGEILAVTGASGVGKSTLLHIMGGLDRPTDGEIIFENQAVFKMNNVQLAEFRNNKIGFVFQFHHLLPEFSALENVAMPLLIRKTVAKEDALARASAILDDVGLSHRFYHLPAQLSGGEQQRVALARAMVTSPLLVLADEPTGNLDTGTGRIVFEMMRRLNEKYKVTFVIASHDLELARSSHRSMKLVAGYVAPDVSLKHN
jgi:lipoprotein-releasing system ATP-binding protein